MIPTAYAATEAQIAAQCLVDKINQVVFFPLIGLLMAIAFLIFLWGAFEFVKNSDNEAGRQTGRTHLLYGTIGMLIMLSAYAILNIAAGTFGLGLPGVNCGEMSESTISEISTSPSMPFGSFDGSSGDSSGISLPGAYTDSSPNVVTPGVLTIPASPDGLPVVNNSPTCPVGYILLNGNCVVADPNTVDISPRENLATEFNIKIDSEIAAGEYSEVVTWYDPDTLVDMSARVQYINDIWPEDCYSKGDEYDFRELDTGTDGIWICVKE